MSDTSTMWGIAMRLLARLFAALFIVALGASSSARAGVILWDFSYNSAPSSLDVISGSGTMTSTDVLVGGAYALIGISDDPGMPTDIAENHDHYLYGAPRESR